MVIKPTNTTERVALVLYHLTREQELSTNDIAKIAGISCNGAWRLASKMSRVVPICNEGDKWSWAGEDSLKYE